jgi:hypothetical protein
MFRGFRSKIEYALDMVSTDDVDDLDTVTVCSFDDDLNSTLSIKDHDTNNACMLLSSVSLHQQQAN